MVMMLDNLKNECIETSYHHAIPTHPHHAAHTSTLPAPPPVSIRVLDLFARVSPA